MRKVLTTAKHLNDSHGVMFWKHAFGFSADAAVMPIMPAL